MLKDNHAGLLQQIGDLRSANLALRRETTFLREELAREQALRIVFERRAKFDELTDLYRRGEFELRARKLLDNPHHVRRGCNTGEQNIYLVLLDIRGFKLINDEGGQKRGDIVIRDAADAIRKRMRDGDPYCRFGGDEFGALLIGVSLDQVRQIVEKINQNVSEIDNRISFRFGYARYLPGDTYDSLCQRADDDLYEKKRQEKNN